MKRHALVIGIDTYPGFGAECQLAGAVRDARLMAELLSGRYGFAPEDVLELFDQEATREALLAALQTLQRRVVTGDQVVLFFSGHGSQMTDREGDEGDGLDETLVPYDSSRGDAPNRDLSDDELNHWAAGILEVTPHLVMIFDCCHAATLHRPNWRVRSVPADRRPVADLPPSPLLVGRKTWRDVRVGRRPLVLAACRDEELAFELPPSMAGHHRGAFSFHLHKALADATTATSWRDIFTAAAAGLVDDCREQHPVLSGDGIDRPLFDNDVATSPVAISQHLLALAEPPDLFGLTLELFHSPGGAWLRTTGSRSEEASLVAGHQIRADLCHDHDRELFVYLFDVGLTGEVTLLFPDAEGHEVLDPGIVLTVGARRGDALDLHWPADLETGDSATGQLLLVAAESRQSTSRLLAGAVGSGHGAGKVAAIVRPYRLFQA